MNIIVHNYDGRLCPAAHGRHKLFPQTLFEGAGGNNVRNQYQSTGSDGCLGLEGLIYSAGYFIGSNPPTRNSHNLAGFQHGDGSHRHQECEEALCGSHTRGQECEEALCGSRTRNQECAEALCGSHTRNQECEEALCGSLTRGLEVRTC